ncbi:MAG: sugar phosphate isomerase/epimerase [Deltaproteobacteria bacterium]|jgi:sugar phosphate isomerase/epimerase|nr:sugar phosphate isomerase/epimerase [Deltaproteobacteria bacterium]
MRLFATLYLASAMSRDPHFQLLRSLGYLPELYFNRGWDTMDLRAHRELARVVTGELGGCGVHLPYRGSLPGTPDRAGREMMRRASAAAALYGPAHMVAHACFRPLLDSEAAPTKHVTMGPGDLDAPIARPSAEWLENSVATWEGAIGECGAKLFLENTAERSPYAIRRLLDFLPPDRAGMCLDVGHWHLSGNGSGWKNLHVWLDMAGDRIGHLHLHDNDASADQHLALGRGEIDFNTVWSLLCERGMDPSATLENHHEEGLAASARYLAAHPFPPEL